MGKALVFIMGSLEVNGEAYDDYDWDPDTRLLTINVPDSQALTLTYKARVNLSVGEELTDENAYNHVNLFGFDEASIAYFPSAIVALNSVFTNLNFWFFPPFFSYTSILEPSVEVAPCISKTILLYLDTK